MSVKELRLVKPNSYFKIEDRNETINTYRVTVSVNMHSMYIEIDHNQAHLLMLWLQEQLK